MNPVNNQGHRSRGRHQGNVNNNLHSNNNSVGANRVKVDRLTNELNEAQPIDPISGKHDNKITTFGIGEEDRVESKPKIDPILGKHDNRFTTMMTGEEDGAGSKPKIDPILGKHDNRFTTMMTGEEDGNRFIYSQLTRLNIYKPESFTS
jgi:hypothetical protein